MDINWYYHKGEFFLKILNELDDQDIIYFRFDINDPCKALTRVDCSYVRNYINDNPDLRSKILIYDNIFFGIINKQQSAQGSDIYRDAFKWIASYIYDDFDVAALLFTISHSFTLYIQERKLNPRMEVV